MSDLTQRAEKLQKLVNDTARARERRDDALTKLVKAQTVLRTLEIKQDRFRKSTKLIRKRLMNEAGITAKPVKPPVVTEPVEEPEPEAAPPPAPPSDPKAKAAALRSELRGDRKRQRS